MLRDDLQVALNDVVVALQEAAEGHLQAIQQLGKGKRADALDALARTHLAEAEEIGEHLRALGDRPREADSDYDVLRGLFSQVKASLAPDEEESLMEDRAEAEARIAEQAEVALEFDEGSEELTALLTRLRDAARAAAGSLGGG